MQVSINIPLKADIVHSVRFKMEVVRPGSSAQWRKAQVGHYAEKRGVYIHHSDGEILYVGNTTRGAYDFYQRLRREFHPTTSGNSPLYRLLAEHPKDIYTYFLDLDDIDAMVDAGPMSLTKERKALLMELTLIGIYAPRGNSL